MFHRRPFLVSLLSCLVFRPPLWTSCLHVLIPFPSGCWIAFSFSSADSVVSIFHHSVSSPSYCCCGSMKCLQSLVLAAIVSLSRLLLVLSNLIRNLMHSIVPSLQLQIQSYDDVASRCGLCVGSAVVLVTWFRALAVVSARSASESARGYSMVYCIWRISCSWFAVSFLLNSCVCYY